MRETQQDKIDRLEREAEKLRETVARAASIIARHESGEAIVHMREQRDLLWLFARQCESWAHTCQCGYRAGHAMDKAGLGGQDSEKLVALIDPRLALRLEIR